MRDTALLVMWLILPMLVFSAGVRHRKPVETVIQVETPEGLATISGPGAEWLLETGFPIVTEGD